MTTSQGMCVCGCPSGVHLAWGKHRCTGCKKCHGYVEVEASGPPPPPTDAVERARLISEIRAMRRERKRIEASSMPSDILTITVCGLVAWVLGPAIYFTGVILTAMFMWQSITLKMMGEKPQLPILPGRDFPIDVVVLLCGLLWPATVSMVVMQTPK